MAQPLALLGEVPLGGLGIRADRARLRHRDRLNRKAEAVALVSRNGLGG